MKQFLFSIMFLLIFFINSLNAQQNNCEVLLAEIKGTYTGNCINDKAEGHGKSIGVDTYEGDFKNGYPEGIGTYTWHNQDYYTGSWKRGKTDGNGEMHYKIAMGGDSIVKGFWKKGKYVGLYEKPFSIDGRSSRITKIDCRITNKKGKNIYITTHQLGGNNSMNASGAVIVSVSSISVLVGMYYTKTFQSLGTTGLTKLQDVDFPFKAIFYLSNGEQAEILFNETADYDVYIDM